MMTDQSSEFVTTAFTIPLEGYTTPPSYENESQNPYEYMPARPIGGGFLADATNDGDGSSCKRPFSKRLILDLDNKDIPMFPAPRFTGNHINTIDYNRNYNKRLKAKSSAFSNEEIDIFSTTSIVRKSLLRMQEAAITLQRLKKEREAEANGTPDETRDSSPTGALSLSPLNISDRRSLIFHSTLQLHPSSSFSSLSDDSGSHCQSEGHTTKLKPRPSQQGVALGREIRRRDSGIARCA